MNIPIEAEITFYCANCRVCQTGFTTADGHDTRKTPYGLASDKSLPFGAMIAIPYGIGILDQESPFQRVFVVDDRGGGVQRESDQKRILRLDLRVDSHEQARQLGRIRTIVWRLIPRTDSL